MELKTISEIAAICVTFARVISMLLDSYIKIRSIKSKNHPKAKKGGKKK